MSIIKGRGTADNPANRYAPRISVRELDADPPDIEPRTIATEVLINNPAVANLIREGQVAQLYTAMQAGATDGMHTLDQDLRRLVGEGAISAAVARTFATDPASLDGVFVRPTDLGAESWSHYAVEQQLEEWGS